ncbi:MAG: hypothetical protein M3Q95_09280 [Bacteroidota bacterium]|nr:hypothetical protein [Bacteroidota bacterium]
MKKLKITTHRVSAFILFAASLLPLFSSAQTIKERFDKLLISENFDSSNTHWTTLANADNLFIVQDGEYIVQRKASTAPYAIMASFKENFNNFRAVTSIKLDKSLSESGFAGFMFMIQDEGQGGFLVEINKLREYRLRQIVNGTYKYLTGNSKSGGWVKNNALNDAGTANMIEIRTINRNYDLYFNNTFIQSFSEPAYRSGNLGVIVGPATRCKIDFMYVFGITTLQDQNLAELSTTNENFSSTEPDVLELAESIIKMKTQINTLTEENEGLRKTISAMRSGDQEKDVTVKNFEKQIKALQDQVTKKDQSIDSLIRKNNELLKFKELAGGNENGDIIIALSKNLKAEKEKNTALEEEIRILMERNGNEKTVPAKNNKTTKTETTGTQEEKDTSKKEPAIFKLPDEN